jgi:hypothetical protein
MRANQCAPNAAALRVRCDSEQLQVPVSLSWPRPCRSSSRHSHPWNVPSERAAGRECEWHASPVDGVWPWRLPDCRADHSGLILCDIGAPTRNALVSSYRRIETDEEPRTPFSPVSDPGCDRIVGKSSRQDRTDGRRIRGSRQPNPHRHAAEPRRRGRSQWKSGITR